MLTHSPDENNEIKETAEASSSTGGSTTGSSAGSTGDSTPPVEPVQALDIPEIEDAELDEVSMMADGSVEVGVSKKKYSEKAWEYEQIKKLLVKKNKKQIVKHFIILKYQRNCTPDQIKEAEEFFAKEYPTRSPYSVYQKCLKLARTKPKRILLI